MKRKLRSVIALILIILMLTPQTTFLATAATESKISVSNVEIFPGETVDVTVNIAGNPGVTSVLLKIGYDESVFTLTDVTDGGILGSAFHSNKYKNPYTLSWANDTATTNFTGNGTLVTLTFRVADDAAIKKYPITVTYNVDNYEIIDKDMNPISFNLENGSIDVKAAGCKHTNKTTVNAKPSTCLTQGNNAYTRCNDCGVIVSGSDEKLPIGNHSFGEWTEINAPTCIVSGEKMRICSVCKTAEYADISATGHKYIDGRCIACGETIVTNTATIKVSSESAVVGDEVEVKISFNNNPGVTSVLLKVGYDESVFTLTDVTDGGILGSAFHSNKYKSPYTLSWANDTATTNITSNGTVVTLIFKVADNASIKKYPITLSYNVDNYEIIDKDMNPVSFELENGSIDVKDATDCNHNYKATVTAPTCTSKGYTTYACSICGDNFKTDYIEATGHIIGDWVITKPATSTQTGVKTLYCSVCGEVIKTEIIPIVIANRIVCGTITSYLSNADEVVIELIREGETDPAYSVTVTGNSAEYLIEHVVEGEYSVRVSKKNHVTRTYEITIGSESVVQDMKICPVGDVSGDGNVKIVDYTAVLKHTKKTSLLEGYQFMCADVDGNGKITVLDYSKVLRHVKKVASLWN